MHDQIREVFEVSGFLNILNVTDTRASALGRFNEVA
jgi:stage II sporulation protein AA (anti-sigma F factor antagonist)